MLNSSKSMMNYQYQLNKQLADQNRNWQERMANSAHQREIADLKAAGLNPVLSVTGGQGANTPTGSTASVGDGAGYASALANLEAARINSATQMFMHTTPSSNSVIGQVEYLARKLGMDVADFYGNVGNAIGISAGLTNENSARGRLLNKQNRAMDSIELAIADLSTSLSLAKLSGKTGKSKRIQKKLDWYAYHYPKQYKSATGSRSSKSWRSDHPVISNLWR